MTNASRILVMAHGHPDLIRGGGEIAAYQCYKTYKASAQTEGAWFLAAQHTGHGATGRISLHRPDEYLWDQSLSDTFMMKAANLHEVTGYFAELIRTLNPTVVHSHHYFKFGLEYLKIIKDVNPAIRTVLTLHEYFAICPNAGKMMNSDTGELCTSGAFDTHHACAGEHDVYDLWLRFRRFKNYFDYVDHFIAPSEFLRQRYIEWGIAKDKITAIPNGQPSFEPKPDKPTDRARNRFAFFGQMAGHKGLDVLLRGLLALGDKRKKLRVEVHGANLEFQPKAFRKDIKQLSKDLIADGTLTMMGRYTPDDLSERMARVDWVCVPSVWYENAPLVIQEAFAHGRPVLTSDIGGMKEMVDHDVNGLCLPRGNAQAWGEALLELSGDREKWTQLSSGIVRPVYLQDSCAQLMKIFQSADRVSL